MTKKNSLLSLFICIFLIPAFSQNLTSSRIACGPWIQAVGETEFTVVWSTTVKSIAWVEVAPDDGTHFYGETRPKFYESIHGRRPITTLHTIKIEGLQPGISYRYRVYQQALLEDEGNKRVIFGEGYGDDILKNPVYKVTTLDSQAKSCRFSMLNDIHGNDSLFSKLTENSLERDLDFMLFNGDMLTQIESPQQIFDGYMKSAEKNFTPFLPLFTVRGNHEHRGSASWEFMNYFPSSTNKSYYTFRHGPAFFIALDCGEDKPDNDIRYYGLSLTDQLREEQALWLEEVVSSDEFQQAPVKIVILHMPPGTEKDWHGMREISRLFVPILNKASIDLMLSGHLHRHFFIQTEERGNNFPILINSNIQRLDVFIDENEIKLTTVDQTGQIQNNYTLKTKFTH